METEAKELTMNPYRVYAEMAEIFQYPHEGYGKILQGVQEFLEAEDPSAAARMKTFTDSMLQLDQAVQEELYGGTFEVQAITSLDVSYILFGDDYKRGQMLSKLNSEMENVGLEMGSELPDHLPNILRLLPELQDELLREDLVKKALMPALETMIKDFHSDRMEMKRKMYKKHHKGLLEKPTEYNTIFQIPLVTLKEIMERDIGEAQPELLGDRSKGFLGNLNHEIEVEHSIDK